jgi:uncharacterized cupredoxin-like copper-binding protein
MRKLWTILLMFALASIVIVACATPGDSTPGAPEDEGLGGEEPETGANTVDVTLTEYQISMPTTLQAGPTTFTVSNTGAETHGFEVEGQGIEEELEGELQPGDSGTLEVNLEPGTYTIYCPVNGHRGLGMELSVTVQ